MNAPSVSIYASKLALSARLFQRLRRPTLAAPGAGKCCGSWLAVSVISKTSFDILVIGKGSRRYF
ncbi:hypothetical protein U1Q18_037184 [Sarracenia purpurea var. burkii]